MLSQGQVAEAVGFEPTVGFPLRSVSNRVLSASQPRFRRDLFSDAGGRGQEGKRDGGAVSMGEGGVAPRGVGRAGEMRGGPDSGPLFSLGYSGWLAVWLIRL